MGDRFVLLVDRLLTESTLEAAIESLNLSKQTTTLGTEDIKIDFSSRDIHSIDCSIPRKIVECRICQDEDEDSNMETPCSCCGSLKFMVLLILRHTLPILVNGAQDYSFPLFLLLLLRTTGIIVPINIMVKAVNAIKCCQRQRINSVATIPQFTRQSLNENTTADKSDYL